MSAAIDPVWDSPRKALGFALNHHLALPRPAMNKMMADGKVQRIELADGTRITVAAPKAPPRSEQLRGLDGAATAGMVMMQLARLPDVQQLVLIAQTVKPYLPCSCRAPCCSGERRNADWSRAVDKICDHLRDRAQLSRIPGKKGMSTAPLMRRALVEKYFVPKRDLSIADLALLCNVSQQTVMNHRKPIADFLDAEADAGWRAFDEILGEAGIVGWIG